MSSTNFLRLILRQNTSAHGGCSMWRKSYIGTKCTKISLCTTSAAAWFLITSREWGGVPDLLEEINRDMLLPHRRIKSLEYHFINCGHLPAVVSSDASRADRVRQLSDSILFLQVPSMRKSRRYESVGGMSRGHIRGNPYYGLNVAAGVEISHDLHKPGLEPFVQI